MRGARQTPQRIEIVVVVEANEEAEDEGLAEEVDVKLMQNRMTTKRIKAK